MQQINTCITSFKLMNYPYVSWRTYQQRPQAEQQFFQDCSQHSPLLLLQVILLLHQQILMFRNKLEKTDTYSHSAMSMCHNLGLAFHATIILWVSTLHFFFFLKTLRPFIKKQNNNYNYNYSYWMRLSMMWIIMRPDRGGWSCENKGLVIDVLRDLHNSSQSLESPIQ